MKIRSWKKNRGTPINNDANIKMKIANFQWFSVAQDGRNDTSDTTQLAVFVARIYMGFNITQEFVSLTAMKGTTVCAH
jgi:hypothetical protein